MTSVYSLGEFYPNFPIPIGENDLHSIKKQLSQLEPELALENGLDNYSHWLIALVGDEKPKRRIKWRVAVFPSEENGYSFNSKFPYFTSPLISSFHEAFELAIKLTAAAKLDQLSVTIK